jgi:hypothetical protein
MYHCTNCDSRFDKPNKMELDPLDYSQVNNPQYVSCCPDCDSSEIEEIDRFEGLTLEEYYG